MKKIMFVCLGNICRSPLAEAVLQSIIDKNNQSKNFLIDSSGTSDEHEGQSADARTQKVAESHGFTIKHRAKQLTHKDIETFDLILAMDKEIYNYVLQLADSSELKKKVHMFREFDPEGNSTLEVPDPYYDNKEGFENIFQIILRTSQNIFDKLV